MRNRPDSLHRLAAIQAVDSPRSAGFSRPVESVPAQEDPGEVIGGWVPDFAEAVHPEPVDPDAVDPGAVDPEDRPLRARRVRGPRRLPWGRTAQRWVPESLRDSRIDPGRRGALLLTGVAAVAALVAAVGVWRDRPEPRPVQAISLSQVTDGPAAVTTAVVGRAAGTALSPVPTSLLRSKPGTNGAATSVASPSRPDAASAAGPIVVSVTGAVRRPGVVTLAAGSRVADAIAKAGGATSQADLTGLNLAERLTDGASVVVADAANNTAPVGGSSSVSGGSDGSGAGPDGAGIDTSASPSAPAGKVDLNTADVAALDALPGVGPVTAASIVAWRGKNGRFTSVEQLQEISGIGPAKYAALSPLVKV